MVVEGSRNYGELGRVAYVVDLIKGLLVLMVQGSYLVKRNVLPVCQLTSLA